MRTAHLNAIACLYFVACATEGSPKVHGVEIIADAGEGTDSAAQSDSGKAAGDASFDTGAPDAAGDAAPAVDAASDAGSPGCGAGATVLLAGSAASLAGGGASGNAVPTVIPVNGSAIDRIAIAPSGANFVAAIRASNGLLASSVYSNAWSSAAAVPNAKATIDAPSLATLAGTTHLAYHDANFKFEHRQFSAGAWDVADDPVGGGGNSQAFGPSGASIAAAGSELEFVQSGDNYFLYDLAWKSSLWQSPHQQPNAAIEKTLPPTVVALTGGTQELLAVYLRKGDFKIMSVARSGGVWDGNPVLVDVNAFSSDALALAPMGSGRALLAYRGSNQQPYFSVYDPAKSPAWTAPAALYVSNPTIASPPSLAAGICADAAVIAYAKLAGGVEIAHFDGAKFGPPVSVAGTSSATFVAIATRP